MVNILFFQYRNATLLSSNREEHIVVELLWVLPGLKTVTYRTNELMSRVLWVLPDSFIGAVRFRRTSGYRGGIDRHSILALFELYVNNDFTGRAVIEVSVCSSPRRDLSFYYLDYPGQFNWIELTETTTRIKRKGSFNQTIIVTFRKQHALVQNHEKIMMML